MVPSLPEVAMRLVVDHVPGRSTARATQSKRRAACCVEGQDAHKVGPKWFRPPLLEASEIAENSNAAPEYHFRPLNELGSDAMRIGSRPPAFGRKPPCSKYFKGSTALGLDRIALRARGPWSLAWIDCRLRRVRCARLRHLAALALIAADDVESGRTTWAMT
jgi:hypothetical protein